MFQLHEVCLAEFLFIFVFSVENKPLKNVDARFAQRAFFN